jgi:hypothetical protein
MMSTFLPVDTPSQHTMSDAETIFKLLLKESPSFHGAAGESQWSLGLDTLQWLLETVRATDTTLETGCGYSTIIFAARGCRHTVISPTPSEHERIRQWGSSHGVNFSKVQFIAAKSEDVLPSLAQEPLDLVLIDGWHAFPAPFIDWFYTCQRLSLNGRMVVDDTQIRACRMLSDFLCQEHGRWELETRLRRTDVFKKVKDQVFEGDWRSQPYGAKPLLSLKDRWQTELRPKLVGAAKHVPGLVPALKKARALITSGHRES